MKDWYDSVVLESIHLYVWHESIVAWYYVTWLKLLGRVWICGLCIQELVPIQAHAGHFEKDATVLFVLGWIESFNDLLSQTRQISCFFLSLWLQRISVCDDILVAITNGSPLSLVPKNLVDQTSDAVHLDNVLDVLLFAKPPKRQIKLLVPLVTIFHPFRALHALFQTAANVG